MIFKHPIVLLHFNYLVIANNFSEKKQLLIGAYSLIFGFNFNIFFRLQIHLIFYAKFQQYEILNYHS